MKPSSFIYFLFLKKVKYFIINFLLNKDEDIMTDKQQQHVFPEDLGDSDKAIWIRYRYRYWLRRDHGFKSRKDMTDVYNLDSDTKEID